MAQFDPAYEIVIVNEGGYLNDPQDHGGETYRGIARKKFPQWEGWTLIDFYKNNRGLLKTNQFIEGNTGRTLDILVKQFYKKIWNNHRLSEINSQAVANIFYDFIILASNAVRLMQSTLKSLGHPLAVDGIIGSQTIAAINKVDAAILHNAYKKGRVSYHTIRVKAGKVAAKWLPGWLRRTERFADLVVSKKKMILITLVAIAGITALFTIILKNS